MNWRGISGIYAGLAIVLASAWFWVQSSALWALGVVALGLVVAGLGVAHIVLKRRGPRSPASKAAKRFNIPRAARGAVMSSADDAEADSVAKSRMAMIAGRANGRAAMSEELVEDVGDLENVEEEAHVENVDSFGHAETEPVRQLAEGELDVLSPDVVGELPVLPEAGDIQQVDVAECPVPVESAPVPEHLPEHLDVPDLTGTREWSAAIGAPVGSKPVVSEALVVEPGNDVEIVPDIEPDAESGAEPEILAEVDLGPLAATDAGDGLTTALGSADGTVPNDTEQPWTPDPRPVPGTVPELAADMASAAEPAAHEPDAVMMVAPELEDFGPVALESLPGFPWTARFIGIWAREVRFACPDDLRGAVIHWQRWADGQPAGTPLIEEAAEEFKAMLDVWRECGAEVPGLSSDGWTAGQLSAEAGEDATLAALLPRMLRTPSVVAY